LGKVRVGVIGVGNMGRHHVKSYAALKHICDLVGIYDIDEKKGTDIAKGYGIEEFSNPEELLDNVDAVSIVTPTTTHYELARKALEKDLDVLIEKPITSTVEEAQKLLKLAKRKERILQVGHIERFNPAVMELPKILRGQRIIAISMDRMGPFDPRIEDTDVVQDLMIHDIDIMRSILPQTVKEMQSFGRVVRSSNGHVDFAVANLLLEDNIIVSLTASRVTNKKVRRLTITTMAAYIELDYLERRITISHKGGYASLDHFSEYHQENKVERVFSSDEEPLRNQLAHFIGCIQEGTKPIITGNDGLEALRISMDIQKNIKKSLTSKTRDGEALSR